MASSQPLQDQVIELRQRVVELTLERDQTRTELAEVIGRPLTINDRISPRQLAAHPEVLAVVDTGGTVWVRHWSDGWQIPNQIGVDRVYAADSVGPAPLWVAWVSTADDDGIVDAQVHCPECSCPQETTEDGRA